MLGASPATVRALLAQVGGRLLAMDTTAARGVVVPDQVTHVPRASDVLLGLIAVRGGIVPLIDLAALLDSGTTEPTGLQVILLEGDGQEFAFPVHEVLGFHALPLPPITGELTLATTLPDGRTVEYLDVRATAQALASRVALQ